MDRTSVALGGVVSAVASIIAVVLYGPQAAAPWGLLAGAVVALRARDATDGLFDGALAGLVGAVGAVLAVVGFYAVEVYLLVGSAEAAGNVGAYFSVPSVVMLVPSFALGGMLAGALGVVVRDRVGARAGA
ncbi:hypothetical protein [Haloprofundus salilacus]|uniref:hypothetical protein n=1 Tax=Haloprofundus salilacus TaxID=2876190 RepID=UPI001CCFAB70|nr:hypothetical protein [Haloprofundus salilacus]